MLEEDLTTDTSRQLRPVLLSWLVLVILFNLTLAAEHLWYHEDLFGHLMRHWRFAVLFPVLLNGLFAAAMLVEIYLCVFVNKTLGRVRHVFRIAFFLFMLGYFAFGVKAFYNAHPVPHHPQGPSFLYKP